MKNKAFYTILILLTFLLGNAQTDDVSKEDEKSINGNLSLRGRWQTGNLNQVSIMPGGTISMDCDQYNIGISFLYHYIKVNGFEAKNDFWNNVLIQYQPKRRLFPSFHVIAGYAKSYSIDHSIAAGPGIGLNIHRKSKNNFIQVHCYGAYLDFQYEEQQRYNSFSIGTLLKSKIPINDYVAIQWELSTYYSLKDNSYWGGGNLWVVNFEIHKNLFLNITHQTYYNNQTAINIKKTNTEMLFGIQYNFSNT